MKAFYNNRYDKYKRDKESTRFYKSSQWAKTREIILTRDNYLCQNCLKNNRIKKADVVHHIKELRDYPELAFDESNLVSWCHTCHTRHHKSGKVTEEKTNPKIKYLEIGDNEEIV